MSIFEWLGFSSNDNNAPSVQESSAVNDIVVRLKHLDPGRARWVAAFAMVMARAARADFEISGEEFQAMERILREYGGLDAEQSTLAAEMAAHRNQLLGASEDYLATREFRKIAAEGDSQKVLHCLFAVSAADDSISLVEEEEIRQVANELGVEHAEFNAIRARFRDKREILKKTARKTDG